MEMEKKRLPGLIIQTSLEGVFHMEMEKRCLPGLIIQSSLEGVFHMEMEKNVYQAWL